MTSTKYPLKPLNQRVYSLKLERQYKILFFCSRACSPCVQQTVELDLYEALDDAYPWEKVYVDDPEAFEDSVRYNIRSVPSLILVDDQGEPVSTFAGQVLTVERLAEL